MIDANELRKAFTNFFVERDHTPVQSSGLIPHHPAAPLFTNAGMVQFLPIFLSEEAPPYKRATSVQKCARVRGKHDDIENIGKSTRHLTFFEMLGNFSFGDYFKSQAIPWAWELLTEVFGFEGDRLWASVYLDDDEAAEIWRDIVGLPPERIQRFGGDNFWEMAETGPCGPCSEIFYDKGSEYGADGGPAHGGDERFVEIWNLVFMQFSRSTDGSLAELSNKNIDTGAGFERLLSVLQHTDSVFETPVLRPIVEAAEQVTGRKYGADERVDVSLRILADHARAMTFLVNDGVFPSNEDRGYVLRRIIRRAVRQAYQLDVEKLVGPSLVRATVEVMGDAYPDIRKNHDFVASVVAREEERFRQTLKSGSAMLDEELDQARGTISGQTAFRLHDTFGFPIDLTREIVEERGGGVDLAGFETAMEEQRKRARDAVKKEAGSVHIDAYREVLDQFGTTEFTGYQEYDSTSRVLSVISREDGRVEVFLDRTPFYAEGGGQVGDTGFITTETGKLRVIDTTYALPKLNRHLAKVVEGKVLPGQEANASVDGDRRDAIRRNHTGTHILHWALREVLGSHVKQAGSLVAPDRLRFDFNHYEGVTDEQIEEIEALANAQVLINEPVRAYETTKEHAFELGAIAFFGDKYGDFVRVLEAGSRSLELCGGTHVNATGSIGLIKVVSEASIGSNVRRIEAVTGGPALQMVRDEQRKLRRVADMLRSAPQEVEGALERVLDRQKRLEDEVKNLRARSANQEAQTLAKKASEGTVIARRDDLPPEQMRSLAVALRDLPGVNVAVLGGSPDGKKVALVAAVSAGAHITAADAISDAAKLVGGGAGPGVELAMAGGKDVGQIDAALDLIRQRLGLPAHKQ